VTDIRFVDVSKHYGDAVALQSLDLAIAAGEFVSLLGPSGSGKTTTLNILAGLTEPTSGDVFIGDRCVTRLPPNHRDLAMVFQNFALYPHMTVFENLAFPLKARSRKWTKERLETSIDAVAETLGIQALLHRYPKELSGGQQQRVALGRGMVRDPAVFLLDEPLSNLDARLRVRMRLDLKALHARIGSTIVYVTHDQEEAMTLSTRIAVFDRGHLQQFGEPRQIYAEPVNRFVANFVGEREINLLDGELRLRDGRAVFEGAGIALDVGASDTVDVAALAGACQVGIRAEAVVLAESETRNTVTAKVEETELTGSEQVIHVRTASGATLACRATASLEVGRGDVIRLALPAAATFVFDAASGASLRRYERMPASSSRDPDRVGRPTVEAP